MAIGRIWFSIQLLSAGNAGIDEARERDPPFKALVQDLGGSRVARHLLALLHHPLVQGDQYRASVLLAHLKPLWY